ALERTGPAALGRVQQCSLANPSRRGSARYAADPEVNDGGRRVERFVEPEPGCVDHQTGSVMPSRAGRVSHGYLYAPRLQRLPVDRQGPRLTANGVFPRLPRSDFVWSS